jgi:hypothetical protein
MRRSLEVAEEAGFIEEEIPVDGLYVQASVISPLAKQQSMDDVNTVVQWMEIMNSIAGQEVSMLGAKVELIPEYVADKLGVPSKLTRSEDERGQIQQAVTQMLAQMKQAQEQPQQGA